MIKYLDPLSFQFDQIVAERVKVSSRGLRGNDLNAFIKRAGVNFIDSLHQLRPGEVPVHWLAVGATEHYGANRNGDGFDHEDCRDYHDTFSKYGHYFRDHQNKADNLRYGRIVKSAYHEPMHRIELLIGLFEDAEAAARAGELGRVADKELEKLARGEDLPGSMACRVRHDVCNRCGNKAADRSEYCDVTAVKLARRTIPACTGFGCKQGLTKVGADGVMQFVHNPRPVFFDFSGVYRNADRIALSMGVLEKAASAGSIGGAAMAGRLAITAPGAVVRDMASPGAAIQFDELTAMARAERTQADWASFDGGLKSANAIEFPKAVTPAAVFRAAADAGVLLPVDAWLSLVGGKQAEAAADTVASRLPGVFSRMLADDATIDQLESNPYMPATMTPRLDVRVWAAKQAVSHGIAPSRVAERATHASLFGAALPRLVKAAALSAGAESLAREYAKYQLAFLVTAKIAVDTAAIRPLLARANAIT